jgi:hypothetical protein
MIDMLALRSPVIGPACRWAGAAVGDCPDIFTPCHGVTCMRSRGLLSVMPPIDHPFTCPSSIVRHPTSHWRAGSA